MLYNLYLFVVVPTPQIRLSSFLLSFSSALRGSALNHGIHQMYKSEHFLLFVQANFEERKTEIVFMAE
jgi:hypothetical protein